MILYLYLAIAVLIVSQLNAEMLSRKPKIIIFDLDYTLWPFWVDTHVSPPFKKGFNGVIVDSYGSKITCYPQVPDLLKNLHDEGYVLGVASRTSEIRGARQLIELFGWEKYFTYKEIFPGSKVTHFNNIKKQSSVDFKEMVFFDDEQRNIHDISRLGVTAVFVPDGVSKKAVEDGLKQFSNEQK